MKTQKQEIEAFNRKVRAMNARNAKRLDDLHIAYKGRMVADSEKLTDLCMEYAFPKGKDTQCK